MYTGSINVCLCMCIKLPNNSLYFNICFAFSFVFRSVAVSTFKSFFVLSYFRACFAVCKSYVFLML